jgi:excisionase family DNA binding protein
MQTLEITRDTTGWEDVIAAHVAAGDSVTVRIETPYMTPRQMAESLGVSRAAVQRWIEQGRIATERHGTYHHIPLREVERFRAEQIRGIIEDSLDEVLEDLFEG